MKSKINENIVAIIFITAVAMSTIVAAIIFIPTFIWGICNDLTLSEIIQSYWIDGYYEAIIENWNKIRGL